MSNTIESGEFRKLMNECFSWEGDERHDAWQAVIAYIDKDRENLKIEAETLNHGYRLASNRITDLEMERTICLDAIGRMGDEIAGLKAERASIVAATRDACAEVAIKASHSSDQFDIAAAIRTISPDSIVAQAKEPTADQQLQQFAQTLAAKQEPLGVSLSADEFWSMHTRPGDSK